MYRLEEFEGDEMFDYEGWDYAVEEVDELEEIAWKKPIVKKKDPKSQSKDTGTKKKKKAQS